MDDNPRPQKRLRTDHLPDLAESSKPYCLVHVPLSSTATTPSSLRPLPPQVLLLALPALLAHPPTHEKYGLSLFLSLNALRQCLQIEALAPDIECHAWTAFAEVGLRAIESGFSTSGEHDWANKLEEEVDKAIGKGLLIAQKVSVGRIYETLLRPLCDQNPSLRPLRHHLSLLNAHFAFRNHNTRFARAVLRRLISSFVPSDPPTIVYAAHLALITQLSTTPPSPSHGRPPGTCSKSKSTSPPELQAALTALTNLSALAGKNQHFAMSKLAAVLRVRIVIAAEMWEMVGEALDNAERLLDLVFEKEGDTSNIQEDGKAKQVPSDLIRSYSITTQDVHDSAASQSHSQSQTPSQTPVLSDTLNNNVYRERPFKIPDTDPLGLTLTVHTLILGILYHTHGGQARSAGPRLAALHSVMDSGALVEGVGSDGLVEIPIPPYPSISLRITHPRITFLLTFLISAVAKRDPVGRRPKKKVFAESGIAQCRAGRNEEDGTEINVPLWASLGDIQDIDECTLKIEGDLLCELVAVSIQRYDFDAAENYLATLIAHARTYGFFEEYAPRVTLHYAHFAHAIGDTDRAETCYRVAANLDGAGPVGSNAPLTGGFVAAAARAGEALLRIGLAAIRAGPNISPGPDELPGAECHAPHLDAPTVALTKDAIARCASNTSAPFPALSELLSTALVPSQIIRSKSLLKHALALSGNAGDNHLRALVLAFVGAQYVYTAPEHAMEVLAVCETLGAGMGATTQTTGSGNGVEMGSGGSGNAIGNAPLRLWVGERFLELFNRAGKEKRVRKQEEFNALYRSAVDKARDHRPW